MDKFDFAQCACVLFDEPPPLEHVERVLRNWGDSATPQPGEGEHGWALCGPGIMFELKSGALAIVDVVERPWPDDLAAAQTVPALGTAWRIGAFGAVARPGALARAKDQPWDWAQGGAMADRHRAFVRLRTGHAAFEEEKDEKKGDEKKKALSHDAVYELTILTDLAHDLMRLPGALAFFVPGGEALRSKAQVEAALARKTGVGPPPLEIWSNVRAVELAREADAAWLLLDTIGLVQLHLPDVEAIFAEGKEDPAAVEALLHTAALHLLSGKVIANGSTADDRRGRRWRASAAYGLVSPSRPVVRWLPEESARPAEELLARLATRTG